MQAFVPNPILSSKRIQLYLSVWLLYVLVVRAKNGGKNIQLVFDTMASVMRDKIEYKGHVNSSCFGNNIELDLEM